MSSDSFFALCWLFHFLSSILYSIYVLSILLYSACNLCHRIFSLTPSSRVLSSLLPVRLSSVCTGCPHFIFVYSLPFHVLTVLQPCVYPLFSCRLHVVRKNTHCRPGQDRFCSSGPARGRARGRWAWGTPTWCSCSGPGPQPAASCGSEKPSMG